MIELFCTDIRGADERRAKRKGRSPQRGSAFGMSLLEYAVNVVWHVPMPELTPADGSKPEFIGDTGMYFSISHTDTHVMVALSDAPVGVDVQTHRNITKQSADMLMDELERAQFSFYDLWCLRESLYKLNGAGHLRNVLRFRREGNTLIYPVPGVMGALIDGVEGCSAAVCQERNFVLPEIRWVEVRELYA